MTLFDQSRFKAQQRPAPTPQPAPQPAPARDDGLPPLELFTGISQVQASGRRLPNLMPGHYIGRIDRIKYFVNQKNQSPAVAFEMTVMKVLQGEANSNPEGTQFSYMYQQIHMPFKANIKQFIESYFGAMIEHDPSKTAYQEDREIGETIREMCSAEQPLAGKLMELRAFVKMTRANTPFTSLTWLRRVSYEELAGMVDPALRGELAAQIAAEKAEG